MQLAHEYSETADSCITWTCLLGCAGSQALPSEAARAVVMQAAQAFFESASSLEAEEMGLGQITLGLLPDDPEVQQQGNCLQALQELQDYGLQLLPAAYNQVCPLHSHLC